ncbi:MAG: carbohydrate-binding family 9-like protein [Candidatus Marinimicrobia bacterium]|nr:carbohydrate-binding family 9-like protein [Candidatus Neomarinimicrobiota bacterium]MCF7921852.1 carbohydrate-binding family 9-like protein [Candidatus Neomarinimicrobiota bacterium]
MSEAEVPSYTIFKSKVEPEMGGLWEGPAWRTITPLDIANYRPEGSNHRPQSQCKLQYNSKGLYGIFRVEDQFIRCVHTEFQSDVYKDSCVEIFLEPQSGRGYFNFEFNCLGILKASYITDPTKIDGKLKEYTELRHEDDLSIQRYHSLKDIHDPDSSKALTWYLEFFIPFSIMKSYLGPSIDLGEWRGNFFKCGDQTSHPHWASWTVLPVLNFHLPNYFGHLIFAST